MARVTAHKTSEPTDALATTAAPFNLAMCMPVTLQATSGASALTSCAHVAGPGGTASTVDSATGIVAPGATGAWHQQTAPQATNAVMAQYMLFQQQLQFQQAQANAIHLEQLYAAQARSAATAAAAPRTTVQGEEGGMHALLALARAAQDMPLLPSPSPKSEPAVSAPADAVPAPVAPRGGASSGASSTRGRRCHAETTDLDDCGPFRCGYSRSRPDALEGAAAAAQLPPNRPSKSLDWGSLGQGFCDEGMCSFQAGSIDELSEHRSKAHGLDVPRRDGLVCMLCYRKVSCRSHLNRHIRSCHTRAFRYDCGTCGRSFSSVSNRDAHIRSVHQKRRPHGCPLCFRAFSRRTHLRVHCTKIHKVNIDEMRASQEVASKLAVAAQSTGTGGAEYALSTLDQAQAIAAAPAAAPPRPAAGKRRTDATFPPPASIDHLPMQTTASGRVVQPPSMASFAAHRSATAQRAATAQHAAMPVTPPSLDSLASEASRPTRSEASLGSMSGTERDAATPITSIATLVRDAAAARANCRSLVRV
jgi:hypothetical protein